MRSHILDYLENKSYFFKCIVLGISGMINYNQHELHSVRYY